MGGSAHEARSVVPFRNFEQEMKHPGVWETDKASNSADNLASLYRPPFALMYHGSFEKVKVLSCYHVPWILPEFHDHTPSLLPPFSTFL